MKKHIGPGHDNDVPGPLLARHATLTNAQTHLDLQPHRTWEQFFRTASNLHGGAGCDQYAGKQLANETERARSLTTAVNAETTRHGNRQILGTDNVKYGRQTERVTMYTNEK
ncbi:hypothetical protein DPEC_G00358720 [Dallia pectoralis]|uniref:Uncharacterized protein n=1 Tax=Dallia pectoralis TaxID=75939 RepID=A0ACC2F0I9_DALPE|nr:hypothetical protein DPEC_G00358720 [Dallia pectoralis]